MGKKKCAVKTAHRCMSKSVESTKNMKISLSASFISIVFVVKRNC